MGEHPEVGGTGLAKPRVNSDCGNPQPHPRHEIEGRWAIVYCRGRGDAEILRADLDPS